MRCCCPPESSAGRRLASSSSCKAAASAQRALRVALSLSAFRPAEDVLLHGHIQEEGVILEEAGPRPAGRQVDVLPLSNSTRPSSTMRPLSGFTMPRDAAQRHAFAAARRAQKGRGSVPGGEVERRVKPFSFPRYVLPGSCAATCFLLFFSRRFTASSTTAEMTMSTSHCMAPASSLVRQELVDGGGDGGRPARGVARDHAGSTVLAQGPGKASTVYRPECLSAAGHPHPPEYPRIGLSQCLGRPRPASRQSLEAPRAVRYISGKATTMDAKMALYQFMTSLTPKCSRKKMPSGRFAPKEQQQEIAHHRAAAPAAG